MNLDKPSLRNVSLSDKYTFRDGRVFINGVQALARLPMIQQERDKLAGLNTAGFISGYRGSPLGGFDAALWALKKPLADAGIVFQPGVNEELAATAVIGSQQIGQFPDPKYDGVFAIWYGKGPGVDRAMDAIKHGNYSGAHEKGGVLVVYGDDHAGKSSTVAHQSEQALAAQLVPSLYPASVHEMIDFGLAGWAMSRYAGCWVGLKCVNDTVEQTATVDLALQNIQFSTPESETQGVNFTPIAYNIAEDERRASVDRLARVQAFVRANGLDKVTQGGEGRLGIVTAGKAWQDVQQALAILGLKGDKARDCGTSVYKVGCIWPLEPEGLAAFAGQHDELLFIEEKKSFMEQQAREQLYNAPSRPAISGKLSPEGAILLNDYGTLSPLTVAAAIASRLIALGEAGPELLERLNGFQGSMLIGDKDPGRIPYFCSGCPHNTSTKVPEGSVAMAGIGCHGMAAIMRKETLAPLQMGGEGVNWVGLSHFTNTKHIFQNLGDGTYYHSGLLAIRAAVASGANITYKILYNDAVAMTGGQPVDGPISVTEITHQLVHEGVKRVLLVSDHPEKFRTADIANGVEVYHRDEMDRLQKELRETPGCTAIVYEQTCAAEKRRRRKRGQFPNPAKRFFINPMVCEGCGDCSVQSTCVSLQVAETPFGRKRKIDQSSCNKDYSCVKGFCPSFVTVYDAEPKKPETAAVPFEEIISLPEPELPALNDQVFSVLITGIGGTGVVTVGAVLGMAAHLEHKGSSIFDMTGLSQKNGAVYSHLKIAADPMAIHTQTIGVAEADLVMAFDMVAASRADALACMNKNVTQLVGNSRMANTAKLQFNPDDKVDTDSIVGRFEGELGQSAVRLVDATDYALSYFGDTIAANMFLVGFTWQLGKLPLTLSAVEEAIRINGVAVEFNLQAFRLGRLAAAKPDVLASEASESDRPHEQSFDELLAQNFQWLVDYQDAAYANNYLQLINQLALAETALKGEVGALSKAAARYLAKLMAYKDEYEVARLHSHPEFLAQLREQFGPDAKIAFNLAPPLLNRPDPATGVARKSEFGAWMQPVFRCLAKLKCLRGTALDIFGYTQERKQERQLVTDYKLTLSKIISELREDNYHTAVKLASLPEHIRGYGHVKARHMKEVEALKAALEQQFSEGESEQVVQFQAAG